MVSCTRLNHLRAVCCSLLASFACNAASSADEQAYPARPVRYVLPVAPGGAADVLARIITSKLHEMLGQPWVVDNRGGAGGTVATAIVARAAPDGYTVLQGFSMMLTASPSLYKLPYSVEKDLQPVTLLATAQLILVLHPSVQAGTLKELIALAKQNPGSLNYASSGVGSPLHLAAELFKWRAGVNMVHIAYKGGGPAAAAVLAGETQVLFGSVATTMPHVNAGRLKALATTGAKRSKVASDLPTIAESGFPGFDVSFWYALLVPARTPMAIVRRLRDEAAKAVGLFDVQQGMARLGIEPESSTPEGLAARIKAESAVWAAVIKETAIRAE